MMNPGTRRMLTCQARAAISHSYAEPFLRKDKEPDMKLIGTLHEGDHVSDVYLCKMRQQATSKAGKEYENVTLQDSSGSIDCKIWEPNSTGIEEFSAFDYIYVVGDVTTFQNNLQLVGRYTQLNQPADGALAGETVQTGDHQMPGQSRAHCHAGCRSVPDLTDHDDVRIVPHQLPDAVRIVEILLFIDLQLHILF